MKLGITLTIEHIKSGIFTCDELVLIIRAMIDSFKGEFPEPDSPMAILRLSLEKAIADYLEAKL